MKTAKRPEKTANGFLPANHFPWRGAFVFYRPFYGIVHVAFGNGDNAPDPEDGERDCRGNLVDDYVMVRYYLDPPEDGAWRPERISFGIEADQADRPVDGLLFKERDGFCMTFARKSYPSADLRDLLREALKCIGWPTDVERKYFLLGTEGKFNWNGRPTKRKRRNTQ